MTLNSTGTPQVSSMGRYCCHGAIASHQQIVECPCGNKSTDRCVFCLAQVSNVPEENIDKMVKELKEREEKRKSFSRRRKFNEDKDIDSINDRNEHFNKKIERAFGKYTLEIKNNLERGTALPD